MFNVKIRKMTAPPTIHVTALFGVERIVKKPEVQDRFERMTAIFETIKVTNVRVLTLFSEYPILRPIRYTNKLIIRIPIP